MNTLADVLGIGSMLGHPFMQHAFLAGTAIAIAAGLVGYFVVLRGQIFAGDALSHVAFAGAAGALAAGIDVRVGLFAGVIGIAILLGLLGGRGRPDDVVIGAVFAWVLGLGVLFLELFTSSRSSANGNASTAVLFGSILSFDTGRMWWVVVSSLAVVAIVIVLARVLLFASIDPVVAASAGVRVDVLGLVFLILVGVTAGVATQAVGALLLLALLAGPAAAAQRLTARPSVALVIAASIAVAAVWIGLTVSYRFDRIPPSVAITAGVTVGYVLAVLWSRTRSTAHASAGRGIMPVGDHARDASGLVPRSVRGASAPLLGWKRLD